MPKYTVWVPMNCQSEVQIEADSESAAIAKAKEMADPTWGDGSLSYSVNNDVPDSEIEIEERT